MDDEVFLELERQSRRRTEMVRSIIIEEGRPDVLAEFDAAMRDLRLGITEAKNAWHSISKAQRFALNFANHWGGRLWRQGRSYAAAEHGARPLYVIGVPTMRNLCARELMAWDGGAFDPEAQAVVTERGRFVLKHGLASP